MAPNQLHAQKGKKPARRERENMANGNAEVCVPLLETKPDVYFDGCPGCAMDRRNAENKGLPYALFFHVWIITLVTCMCHLFQLLILNFL